MVSELNAIMRLQDDHVMHRNEMNMMLLQERKMISSVQNIVIVVVIYVDDVVVYVAIE